jgi:hypothetical protein
MIMTTSARTRPAGETLGSAATRVLSAVARVTRAVNWARLVTMNIRATIGAAAALGVTGIILLPAAASAHAVTPTLTFTSVHLAQ